MLTSFSKTNSDDDVGVCLVFSSLQDLQSFTSQHWEVAPSRAPENATYSARDERITSIIISFDERGPVVTKKLRALELVFQTSSCTEWALAVDAELKFVSDLSLVDRIKIWAEKRTIYGYNNSGNILARYTQIMEESCNAIGIKDSNLQEAFTWWSDIPVYEKKDFFEFIGMFRWHMLTQNVFDHVS